MTLQNILLQTKEPYSYYIECIPKGQNIIFTIDDSWNVYTYGLGLDATPIKDNFDVINDYLMLKGLLIEEYILYGTIVEKTFYLSDMYDIRKQSFVTPFNRNIICNDYNINTIPFMAEGELLNQGVINEIENCYDGELMITFFNDERIINKYILLN